MKKEVLKYTAIIADKPSIFFYYVFRVSFMLSFTFLLYFVPVSLSHQ